METITEKYLSALEMQQARARLSPKQDTTLKYKLQHSRKTSGGHNGTQNTIPSSQTSCFAEKTSSLTTYEDVPGELLYDLATDLLQDMNEPTENDYKIIEDLILGGII